uniref:major histocompatibility complex class I-related gene protein-like n=1 Tax=Pristiophorus japonicus TaxID=55135 RepID=UPI00398F335E
MFLSLVLSFHHLQAALSVFHSLLYYYTLSHGSADLPEYSFLGRLDGSETTYYDNNMNITVPRQHWMAKAFNKRYWEEFTITQAGFHGIIKGQFDRWLQQGNQTSSTHYIQGLFGCELHDANPIGGVLKLAYDGRYALCFDKDTLVWTVHDPIAQMSKAKWDKETKLNRYFKSLIEKDCVNLWRTYYSIGNVSLTRKGNFPEVSVIARAGDRWFLHCIVIGFYPQSINVTWLKNGEHVPETKSTGVLPNEDGTYQLTTSLEFDPYDGKQYFCHIEHSSLSGGKTVPWEGKVEKDKDVVLIVLGVLLSLAIVLIVIYMWRKKRRATAGGANGALRQYRRGEVNPMTHAKSPPPIHDGSSQSSRGIKLRLNESSLKSDVTKHRLHYSIRRLCRFRLCCIGNIKTQKTVYNSFQTLHDRLHGMHRALCKLEVDPSMLIINDEKLSCTLAIAPIISVCMPINHLLKASPSRSSSDSCAAEFMRELTFQNAGP